MPIWKKNSINNIFKHFTYYLHESLETINVCQTLARPLKQSINHASKINFEKIWAGKVGPVIDQDISLVSVVPNKVGGGGWFTAYSNIYLSNDSIRAMQII